jgi:bacteriophage CI repressor helix-turn-helix domain|uniref:Repressor protein CI n=1 Tax=Myoviridae sp. ct2AC8 TaxID=2827655 RepID=A0A8S5TPW6_9CAUD|nr:MAG TPA: Repressor protein CI [Myoviridae sp. ct2AC8]
MAEHEKVETLSNKVTTRLKDILDNDFPNRESAAIVVGKDKDMISRYASGKSVPPFDAIIKIAKFANVSLDWLAFGRGEKYEKNNSSLPSDVKKIKVYDITVSAGSGCFVDDEYVHSTIILSKEFLDIYGLSDHYVGVFISGDSMMPKLMTSDTAIIDTDVTTLENDDIYVFSYENHCYIKQLQKMGREIRVKSLNPNYESWTIVPEVEGDKFKIIGKLALVIKKP